MTPEKEEKMSYYKTCPHCGANLDPGEVCDCTLTQVCAEARETFPERFTGKTDREVVAEIEQIDKAVSASIMNETEEKVK